jgi:autotransporter-associated beta strand protein
MASFAIARPSTSSSGLTFSGEVESLPVAADCQGASLIQRLQGVSAIKCRRASMNKQTTRSKRGKLLRFIKATFMAGLLPALVLMFSLQTSQAGSATWNSNPTSGDWNTAANWTPATVPNSPSDTATFAASDQTAVSLSATFDEVGGIIFNSGASAFTITAQAGEALSISGRGISNDSGITQNFVTRDVYSSIQFFNSATAGSNTDFTTSADGGGFFFSDLSTAANGVFTINGPGTLYFTGKSTAGNGDFTLSTSEIYSCYFQFSGRGSAGNAIFTANCAGYGNEVFGGFYQTSSASNCVFTVNGGDAAGGRCRLFFQGHSTAGNATLVANPGISGGTGGEIILTDASSGGTARFELFGTGLGDSTNGRLNIKGNTRPTVTIGSVEGSGLVQLGLKKLTVGGNNLSTVFSGRINDDGSGSLVKSGRGEFTLSNANTYGGGTIVQGRGILFVNNVTGSGTGTGSVQVNSGVLGGNGIIRGPVVVGNGSPGAARLMPGKNERSPSVLTIGQALSFNADATYLWLLDTVRGIASSVAAKGVTIDSAALFSPAELQSGTLSAGTVFTVINNNAPAAIVGSFSNLPDGGTLTVGSNTFQADYEGGDGNDLTLTVQ